MKSISLSKKLNITLQVKGGDQIVITPVGSIDEDCNMVDIISELTPYQGSLRKIEFNLSKVNQMNSCGVRSWLLMFESFPRALDVFFSEVCPLIVEQASMIPNIIGSRPNQITNFQAPFFCGKCKEENIVVLTPSQITYQGDDPVVPVSKCPKCTQEMVFDSIESEYFFFLKRKKQAA